MEKDEWVMTKNEKFRFINLQIYSFSSFSSSFFSFSVDTSVFFMLMVPCIADKIYFITVQRDATQSSLFIILQVHSTCFGCQPHPSLGVHKTVNIASGSGHTFLCTYHPRTWPSLATFEGGSCTVPETVVAVLCTPNDG